MEGNALPKGEFRFLTLTYLRDTTPSVIPFLILGWNMVSDIF
jgi:hypothetical protein